MQLTFLIMKSVAPMYIYIYNVMILFASNLYQQWVHECR